MLMAILTAVGVLGGLGAGLGLLLGGAAHMFAVEEDPRLSKLIEVLPGANCGACGFAGCAEYARAVLDGATVVGVCPVGGERTAAAMGQIMGVAPAPNRVRQVALVRCTGGGRDRKKYLYQGAADCAAAARVPGGGDLSCDYGCLGLGSCAAACPFGAVSVENGAARVDGEACRGCLKCISACPRGLITLVPWGADVSVLCSNTDSGAQTRMVCADGCVACGLCQRACRCGAIAVENCCAVIDYAKCISCGACVEACPRHLIRSAAQ